MLAVVIISAFCVASSSLNSVVSSSLSSLGTTLDIVFSVTNSDCVSQYCL